MIRPTMGRGGPGSAERPVQGHSASPNLSSALEAPHNLSGLTDTTSRHPIGAAAQRAWVRHERESFPVPSAESVVRPLPDCIAPTAGRSPHPLPHSQFLRIYCEFIADPFRKKSSPKTPGTTGFSALQPNFCIFADQKRTPVNNGQVPAGIAAMVRALGRDTRSPSLPTGRWSRTGGARFGGGQTPATSDDHGRLPRRQPPSLSSFLFSLSCLLSPIS
jgi:hypothetical protein